MKTLTVAMATYKAFDDDWMTIRGLRTYFGDWFDILVIDNAPEPELRTMAVTHAAGGRYVHRPDLSGTSRPRDAAFHLAKTEWVMVIDNHVLLEPGSLPAALAYAKANPHSKDIISGPVIGDDMQWSPTHWKAACPTCLWGDWDTDPEYAARWGSGTPLVQWNKASARAAVDHMDPFEVPGQGLGLFMMRREAWPGFNHNFREFGGEEGYIHEKVRRLGGKAICHPRIRWAHKFRDIAGWTKSPYPNSDAGHIRNLLISHRELGVPDYEALIQGKFGKKLEPAVFDALAASVRDTVPENVLDLPPKPQRILGIWYSNNSAPLKTLQASLATIKVAKEQSRHQVDIVTVPHQPVAGNPFRELLAKYTAGPGHKNIALQIEQGMIVDGYDAVSFLEHDVLYPPGYFDRVGDALFRHPEADVVSHLDYIGLNATGWLACVQRHEPLHQLTVRTPYAVANLKRVLNEVEMFGESELEPDPQNIRTAAGWIAQNPQRKNWYRIPADPGLGFTPSVHINVPGRATSHGEVCYQSVSANQAGGPVHRHGFWGDWKQAWPGEPVVGEKPAECGGCGKPAPLPVLFSNIELWYADALKPSDFHAHMGVVRKLAESCEHVTEICEWGKPARVAMAAGCSGRFVSYSRTNRQEWVGLRQLLGDRFIPKATATVPTQEDFETTDMLFIDTLNHSANETWPYLEALAHKVRKYIVIHTTDIYGETSANGEAGVMFAIRQFVSKNPKWKVKYHTDENYGLMVLSIDPADRVELPPLATMAKNAIVAKLKHWWKGRKYLPLPMAEERLKVCMVCPLRQDMRCTKCGCYLDVVDPQGVDSNVPAAMKGSPGRTFFPDLTCPVGKWGAVDPKTIPLAMYEDQERDQG